MKTSAKLFVISIVKNAKPEEKEFLGIDRDSGGYPYWSSGCAGAKLFGSESEAMDMLQSSDFKKDCVMGDGTKSPPRMIHNGLEINNSNMSAQGIIRIEEVSFVPVFSEPISGKIEKPKEVKYTY